MRVRQLMEQHLITVSPSTPVAAVVKLLLGHNIDAVPVINNEGELVGMVTAGDFLRLCLPSQVQFLDMILYLEGGRLKDEALSNLGRTPTSEVMSRKLTTIEADDSLGKAVGLMVTKDLRQLPVIDKEQVVGMIGRQTVLKMINERMEKEEVSVG